MAQCLSVDRHTALTWHIQQQRTNGATATTERLHMYRLPLQEATVPL
jgi:hypothetical protein